jgi:hypothetical protein
MTFLANLVGSEHIERFIPLAEPENERDLNQQAVRPSETPLPDTPTVTREMPKFAPEQKADPQPSSTNADATRELPKSPPDQKPDPQLSSTNAGATRELPKSPPDPKPDPQLSSTSAGATREMPKSPPGPKPDPQLSSTGAGATRELPKSPPGPKPDPQLSSTSASATREMPQFAAKRRAPAPVATPQVARTERRSGNAKPAPRTPLKQPGKIPASDSTARDVVIADAARLVQWGRKWYELAEIIARMADRPPLPEVRRILKDNKTAIEKKAGG